MRGRDDEEEVRPVHVHVHGVGPRAPPRALAPPALGPQGAGPLPAHGTTATGPTPRKRPALFTIGERGERLGRANEARDATVY
jgi:hypothetical protein